MTTSVLPSIVTHMKLKIEPLDAGETSGAIRKRAVNIDLEDGEIKEDPSSVVDNPPAVDAHRNTNDVRVAADSSSQSSSGPLSPPPKTPPIDPSPGVDRASTILLCFLGPVGITNARSDIQCHLKISTMQNRSCLISWDGVFNPSISSIAASRPTRYIGFSPTSIFDYPQTSSLNRMRVDSLPRGLRFTRRRLAWNRCGEGISSVRLICNIAIIHRTVLLYNAPSFAFLARFACVCVVARPRRPWGVPEIHARAWVTEYCKLVARTMIYIKIEPLILQFFIVRSIASRLAVLLQMVING